MPGISFTYTIPPKSIGGFDIDAFLVEHYSFTNSVTDIPVEDGSNINDHVVGNADELQVKAFIGKAIMEVWEKPIPETNEDIPQQDPKARIREAYLELRRLKEERKPVDVVTGLDTFHDMIITSFEIDRDAETGADLPFDMSFKQIRIVKSEATTINASGPSGDQTAGTGNMGTAGTNKTNPESNKAKEEWRIAVNNGMATREEYFEKWGEPFPE